ncbi:hypothetical protein BV25DRAFT_1817416 [Artomyces pyxidatus]|uniref:Uncharacterized protein n=1 Tax=Artomyces pyxidatus TaxID=48021 RepID=A0ACB8TJC2_9AGAM|nr:hypothetical protein BV25DRAFT_1817416 [Artomyces pyxidatus]
MGGASRCFRPLNVPRIRALAVAPDSTVCPRSQRSFSQPRKPEQGVLEPGLDRWITARTCYSR